MVPVQHYVAFAQAEECSIILQTLFYYMLDHVHNTAPMYCVNIRQ